MFQGLRSVIYHAPDLQRAKEWYAKALGVQPYFDQPFYVGFNIAGYELGLNPDVKLAPPGPGGTIAYWRVGDIHAAVEHFVSVGATVAQQAQEVGEGIKVAELTDLFGNRIGLIEN